MPGFEHALADGVVSTGHVDAVANAAKGLDDAGRERLGGLGGCSVELRPGRTGERVRTALPAARQTIRRRRRRIRARQAESVGVGATLGRQTLRHAPHPPRVWIRSATPSCGQRSTPNSRPSNKSTATPAPRSTSCSLMRSCASVSGERSGERRVPEICVHVDYHTMLNGLHEHSLCETADGIPLPPETVRRLACEAAIVPIVLNSAGEVLDCGREVRVANRAQRRALRAMYRTCGYPGCDVTFDRCDIHHVIEWLQHGSNRSRQSVAVMFEASPPRPRGTLATHPRQTPSLTIHRPDGTRHFHGTTTNRTRPSDSPTPQTAGGGPVTQRPPRSIRLSAP